MRESIDLSEIQCDTNHPFNGESELSLITSLSPRKFQKKNLAQKSKKVTSREDSLNSITLLKKEFREDTQKKPHFATP